jgi:hypothetical protein
MEAVLEDTKEAAICKVVLQALATTLDSLMTTSQVVKIVRNGTRQP